MTKKCIGCGATFQNNDVNKEGYTEDDIDFECLKLCKRCFRIKNYGDYVLVDKDYKEYEKIFSEVKKTESLVLFLCDIFCLDDSLKQLNDFTGKIILVITKGDLLPKSVKENKLLLYVENNYNLNVVDIIFVSSLKNYHLDELMNKIMKHKTDDNVYLVGNTNAGKSTLINQLVKSYSDKKPFITTSHLPATTLDIIKVKLNDDVTLIDTPGLVTNDNYLIGETAKTVKTISPKSEIKPRTFQMKPNQSIIIGNYARIDYLSDINNSFTLYISNDIEARRINLNTNDHLRNLKKHEFNLSSNKDIVISGLCFCKIVSKAKVVVYTKETAKVFERDNLI
ncbi:MAG: GTPase [Bacilli bacterium]